VESNLEGWRGGSWSSF